MKIQFTVPACGNSLEGWSVILRRLSMLQSSVQFAELVFPWPGFIDPEVKRRKWEWFHSPLLLVTH